MGSESERSRHALTAILVYEAEAPALLARLDATDRRLTSPIAVWEAGLAVARIFKLDIPDAYRTIEGYLLLADIKVIAIEPDIALAALTAYQRYGKSRHPAAVNLGDCFAYACARHCGLPLLYKGNDFTLTDLALAATPT